MKLSIPNIRNSLTIKKNAINDFKDNYILNNSYNKSDVENLIKSAKIEK